MLAVIIKGVSTPHARQESITFVSRTATCHAACSLGPMAMLRGRPPCT